MKKTIPLLACISLALALLGCSQPPPIVARLQVDPVTLPLAYSRLTELDLHWTPRVPRQDLGSQPTVFVHLLDPPGKVVRTFDHAVPASWQVGEPLSYQIPLYQSALAPPLPPGDYRLSVGLYNAGGDRWALEAEGEEIDDNEYGVATVEVPQTPPATGTEPQIRFSDAWETTELGTDAQVLARRWLRSEGSLTLGGLRNPVRLRLTLRIPSPTPDLKLVPNEGGETSQVVLLTNCSREEVRLSGPGFYEAQFSLTPTGEAGDCEIVVRPNYYYLSTVSLKKRALALETLAWTEEVAGNGPKSQE